MSNNVMNNIMSIEFSPFIIDSVNPTPHLVIKTRRNNYCFKLSNDLDINTYYNLFYHFVSDVNTPSEVSKPTIENTEQVSSQTETLDVEDDNKTFKRGIATQD